MAQFQSAVQEWQAGVGREALVKMIILNPRLLVFSYKQHVDLQAWFAKLLLRWTTL